MQQAGELVVGRPKGRIILKWIKENMVGNFFWIHVAQYRDQWRVLIQTVMKLRVPYGGGFLNN
jgi:hypothetical protein